MPAAEVPISVELVRCLVGEQHPDLAERTVEFASEGWDSAVFRLGEDLAVRLPRRQVVADLAPIELRWLPVLAPELPLPISAPVRAGRAGCGYPWPWSITTWFPGDTWAEAAVDDTRATAVSLGRFVASLGVVAPAEAPSNPYRGGPLSDRDPALRDRLASLDDAVDGTAITRVWEAALAAPPARDRRWLHGDLHPANIVVEEGQIAAVIDWVDLSAGDRAYDLAAAWMCFPDDATDRAAFLAAAAADDAATLERARACALSHAIACLTTSADNERMRSVGERTLRAVLTDARTNGA